MALISREAMPKNPTPAQRRAQQAFTAQINTKQRRVQQRQLLGERLNLPTDKQQLRELLQAATIGHPITKCPSQADDTRRASHPTATHRALYAKLKGSGV
jgi:hypothetical protein